MRSDGPIARRDLGCATCCGIVSPPEVRHLSKQLAPAPRVLTRQRTDCQVGNLFLCDTGGEIPAEGGASLLAWL